MARDGECEYCDMRPPNELMSTFKPRKDAQIMGLEVLSVALGKCPQLLACSSFCIWNARVEHVP